MSGQRGKTGNILLTCSNLQAGYFSGRSKNRVLKNVQAEFHAGEIVCLIGQNGTGKSTLLKTLAGLQPVIEGEIFLNGKVLHSHLPTELARLISIVLTEKIQVDYLTIRTLIASGRSPYTGFIGKLSREDEEVVKKAADKTGISHLLDKELKEVSDGERQKAMIAWALAKETDIIFLDEPTAFLDINNKYQLMSILKELSAEGKLIILSSHDLDLSLHFAERIALIAEGEMRVFESSSEELNIALKKMFPSLILKK